MNEKINETNLAYIAGLIDGEGSIILAKCQAKDPTHMGKRGFVWEPRISIGMSELQGLKFANKVFGRNTIRKSKTNSPNCTMHYITIYSNKIREFLPKLLPYIKVKKKQAKLLLEVVTILKPKSSKEVDNRLEQVYKKMKVLNHSRYK